MKRTTIDPHPPHLAEKIEEQIGKRRVDISRIARRANKKKTPERPTPEVAEWIAITAAGCPRVHGVKHRRYLAERLRYLLGIDATQPIVDGLKPDDIVWVNQVADDLVATPLKSTEAAA